MLLFITGVPGSGKTYKAVHTIYNNFSNDSISKKSFKKQYENCYTNINELDTNNLKNVNLVKFDVIYEKINELYTFSKDCDSDSELIEKCKELDIYKTFFFIDECHNYFDKQDKVLVWWLSYHRHLYQDIYLVTQNLSLVHSKYKAFSEYFYKAKPTTLVLNRRNLVYDYFIRSNLSLASKAGTEKIKKNQKVFDLYKSGDVVESKNFIMYYILLSLFFLIVLLVGGYFLISSYKNSSDVVPVKSEPISYSKSNTQNSNVRDANNEILDDNIIYISLDCSPTFCFYKNTYFPVSLINTLKTYIHIEVIDVKQYKNNVIMYCLVDSRFNKIIGVTNEKDLLGNVVEPLKLF